jgi:hypothetical protein
VNRGPVFVPFCAWTFRDDDVDPATQAPKGVRKPPVRIACAQGRWKLTRIRAKQRGHLALAAAVVVVDLVCGGDRPIWHGSDGSTDARLRLADLDRMRFDQKLTPGECVDLALELAPDWKHCGGYRFDGARVEMIATFVAGLQCLMCAGSGVQTIDGARLLGLQAPSFSRQCPTCEGSGQR